LPCERGSLSPLIASVEDLAQRMCFPSLPVMSCASRIITWVFKRDPRKTSSLARQQ
jgi:hypothetical protein